MSLIQVTLVVPSLLTLAMGHRTRKMSCATVVIVSCYWLLTGIETADLISIDIVSTAVGSLHAIVSSAAVIAIASILSSSYAVVTLCSFICPTDGASSSRTWLPTFDRLYRVIVGTTGIVFAEIPLVVVRSQVIAAYNHQSGTSRLLPAVFILWFVKDSTFILISMVLAVIYVVRVRRKVGAIACDSCGRMAFDNPDVFFAPEKRDTYIAERQKLAAPGGRTDAPGVRRPLLGELRAVVDEIEVRAGTSRGGTSGVRYTASSSAGGAKKSKKSVRFRLDMNEGCSEKRRNEDDDDDDDNEVCQPTHDNDSDSSDDDVDDTKV